MTITLKNVRLNPLKGISYPIAQANTNHFSKSQHEVDNFNIIKKIHDHCALELSPSPFRVFNIRIINDTGAEIDFDANKHLVFNKDYLYDIDFVAMERIYNGFKRAHFRIVKLTVKEQVVFDLLRDDGVEIIV
jgi:hypothetical protein